MDNAEQLRQMLHEQDNLLHILLDNTIDFIHVKDTESRFILSNAAHLASMGKSHLSEVIGKTDLDLFPSEMAARFWIHVNGPGIAPEDQDRLFTQFTRLEQTHVNGHGLGLSIVQRIVNRLGGKVGLTSIVGEGSVFSFTLPSIEQTS